MVDAVLGGKASGSFIGGPLPLSVSSRPGFVRTFEFLDVQMVFPNATVPPFDDKRVRQALNYAVDRNVVVTLSGVDNQHAAATCQLFPPGIPGYRKYCPYQTGAADGPYRGPDLPKARALVAESGTVGIPIVVQTASSPDS